jgi:hypothetical protein
VIISLNSINQLIFVMVKYGVLFEVRAESLNYFKGLKPIKQPVLDAHLFSIHILLKFHCRQYLMNLSCMSVCHTHILLRRVAVSFVIF